MIGIKINVVGLKESIRNFKGSGEMIAKKVNNAVYLASMIAVRNIKLTTPVLTGNLRRGIRVDEFKKFKATIMPHNAPYAIYVHQRNPFMQRGSDNSRVEIDKIFSKTVDDIAKELAKNT
jgi:hypothetical protein